MVRQDVAVAAMDVLSLLGMVASIIFYSLSVVHTPDRVANSAPTHHDVYDNAEAAEVRVFLPVKEQKNSSSLQNITDPLGSFQVTYLLPMLDDASRSLSTSSTNGEEREMRGRRFPWLPRCSHLGRGHRHRNPVIHPRPDVRLLPRCCRWTPTQLAWSMSSGTAATDGGCHRTTAAWTASARSTRTPGRHPCTGPPRVSRLRCPWWGWSWSRCTMYPMSTSASASRSRPLLYPSR